MPKQRGKSSKSKYTGFKPYDKGDAYMPVTFADKIDEEYIRDYASEFDMMNDEMFDEKKVIEQALPRGGIRADEDYGYEDIDFDDEDEEPNPFAH